MSWYQYCCYLMYHYIKPATWQKILIYTQCEEDEIHCPLFSQGVMRAGILTLSYHTYSTIQIWCEWANFMSKYILLAVHYCHMGIVQKYSCCMTVDCTTCCNIHTVTMSYMRELTQHIIWTSNKTLIIAVQLENKYYHPPINGMGQRENSYHYTCTYSLTPMIYDFNSLDYSKD